MRKKIAILGGGLGSLTAAYWLTEDPAARERYEITVYQQGWRLGGKGASGRNLLPGYGHRIEEHGLHIWFGFYENAFRTLRGALTEHAAHEGSPVRTYASMEEAFEPQSLVTFEEVLEGGLEGSFEHWPLLFPMNDDVPGDGDEVIEPWAMAELILGWVENLSADFFQVRASRLRALTRRESEERGVLPEWARPFFETAIEHTNAMIGRIRRLLPEARGARERQVLLAELIRTYQRALWLVLEDDMEDTEARRFFILNDIAATLLAGSLRDDLFTRGFEVVDGWDWAEWLGHHGAQPITCRSALVRTVYDLVFGFRQGDPEQPVFAAGTALRGLFRLILTYKGALMFKMRGGMGDVVFTPLYAVLKARGVRFAFFHRVEELEVGEDEAGKKAVTAIRVSEQARLDPSHPEVRAHGGYWPFVQVEGRHCWPDRPLFDQLLEGQALEDNPADPGRPHDLEAYASSWKPVGERRLRRGEDFDLVIFGIPIGAVPHVAPALVRESAAWRRMIEGGPGLRPVETVKTAGVQLWLRPSAEALGWEIPEWARSRVMAGEAEGTAGLVGGYAQSLNTWADMSHLLPDEPWPEAHRPGSVAYLCGPIEDAEGDLEVDPMRRPELPRERREALMEQTKAWLHANAAHLWPRSTGRGGRGFDPELLIDPEGREGEARFSAQWYRANFDPSERYVLSVPGSTRARIDPARTGFANLYAAGDWTRNGVLNAGCVEAAVASGMAASRAISGRPERILGEQPFTEERIPKA